MQDMTLSTAQLENVTPPPSIHDPAVEWFLTHCHIHRYPAKYTLIHAGEDAESLFTLSMAQCQFTLKTMKLKRCS